jgi:hypothetical protein
MNDKITATLDEFKAAFTEWERRYRENPEGFWAESYRVAQSTETYGEAAAPYFAQILDELKPAQ